MKSKVQRTMSTTESNAEMQTAINEVKERAYQADVQAVDGQILCAGYEWGPGVPKVIVKLPEAADGKEYAGVFEWMNAQSKKK